jgi:hypothetical protein
MNRLIDVQGYGIAAVELNGNRYLALEISGPRRSVSLTHFGKLRHDPGFVAADGRVTKWSIEGTVEIDGKVYFYGPYRPGRPLHTFIEDGENKGRRVLPRICRSFLNLHESERSLSTNGVYLCDDGGVLFFPGRIIRMMVHNFPARDRIAVETRYNHPDQEYPERSLFFLAALTYRCATGQDPADAGTEDEIESKLRLKKIAPPELINPRLAADTGSLIFQGLTEPGKVSLEDFCSFLSRRGAAYEDPGLPKEEMVRREKEAAKFTRVSPIDRGRLIKLLLFVLLGAAAGLAAERIVSRLSEEPETAGLLPEEVIERFYTGFNQLDFQTMDTCTAKKRSARELKDLVLNVSAVARVRFAYENRDVVLPAEEWKARGKPPTDENTLVFGLTDLKIEPIGGTRYTASYRLWIPRAYGDPPTQSGGSAPAEKPHLPAGYKRRDEVVLTNKQAAWVIEDIETKESVYLKGAAPR